MLFPGERSVRNIAREANTEILLERIHKQGPRAVYGDLFWYAQLHHWKSGRASFAFKEIFGTWPRLRDKCEPMRWEGLSLRNGRR